MNPARHGPLGLVDLEELAHLAQHAVERPGLVARRGLDRVAVHRIARPHDGRPLVLDRANQPRQVIADAAGAEPRDQRQATGLVRGIEPLDQPLQIVGGDRRPAFQPHGVLHPAAELDMRAVHLTGAVADPQHVAGPRDRQAGGRIDPRQRLFVFQQQRLVAGVELHLPKLLRGLGGDAGGLHERHRVADPLGDVAVARGLGSVGEVRDPALNAVNVGIAAGREGAQQVQRRRRLGIGLQHALRVGDAGRGGEVEAVHDVAAIARQVHAVHRLGGGTARLGELPGHAPDLDHGKLRSPRQDHGHLQHDLERVADVVGAELGEAFGAVAPLQQERLARRDLCKPGLQPPSLAREDQRRKLPQLALDQAQRHRVGIVGHLHPRQRPPARPVPRGTHGGGRKGRVAAFGGGCGCRGGLAHVGSSGCRAFIGRGSIE